MESNSVILDAVAAWGPVAAIVGAFTWTAIGLSVLSMMMAALAAILFRTNLNRFQIVDHVDSSSDAPTGPVSILIPARDEAAGIRASVTAALASVDAVVEVVVLDDGSVDDTAAIVRSIMATDDRVRIIEGIDLPDGWNGKQHACYRLAAAAQYEHLMFLDADVRLQPVAVKTLMARYQAPLGEHPVGLLSAFPRQLTETWSEKLLIPMMHQILLCYLPLSRMRDSTHPAYAAGCGQLFLTSQSAYQTAGTHEAIRASRHDGLKLPKAYRQNDLMTDCIDGTDLATCRMYRSTAEVVRGLLKNAHEGIANAKLLLPFTFMLLMTFVAPWVLFAGGLVAWFTGRMAASPAIVLVGVSFIAIMLSMVPRVTAMVRLRQSAWGASMHPVAVAMFLALQWWAMFNHLRGRQVAWRGRLEA